MSRRRATSATDRLRSAIICTAWAVGRKPDPRKVGQAHRTLDALGNRCGGRAAGGTPGKGAQAARPGPAKLGLYLYYLPPHSPVLNRIELVFKQGERHDPPTRRFISRAELRAAVGAGRDAFRQRLRPNRDNPRRPAAWVMSAQAWPSSTWAASSTYPRRTSVARACHNWFGFHRRTPGPVARRATTAAYACRV
jgi:hypothetical protein